MKIFVCGLPKSGRTTVAKAICSGPDQYIDAMSWVRATFRDPHQGEHRNQHEDDYQQYLSDKVAAHPHMVVHHVNEWVQELSEDATVVIDGIASPRDFAALFDFRQDIIIFLNRTDNDYEYRDHENIGISVIRDYCFWMSSAGLITRDKWLEFNFKIPGEKSDYLKVMGAQNSVFIVRSIDRVIEYLREKTSKIIPTTR